MEDLDEEHEYPLSLLSMTVGSRGPDPEWYAKLVVDLLRVAVDEWAWGLGWRPSFGWIDARRISIEKQQYIQRQEEERYQYEMMLTQCEFTQHPRARCEPRLPMY